MENQGDSTRNHWITLMVNELGKFLEAFDRMSKLKISFSPDRWFLMFSNRIPNRHQEWIVEPPKVEQNERRGLELDLRPSPIYDDKNANERQEA